MWLAVALLGHLCTDPVAAHSSEEHASLNSKLSQENRAQWHIADPQWPLPSSLNRTEFNGGFLGPLTVHGGDTHERINKTTPSETEVILSEVEVPPAALNGTSSQSLLELNDMDGANETVFAVEKDSPVPREYPRAIADIFDPGFMPCTFEHGEVQDCMCCISEKLALHRRGDLLHAGMIGKKMVQFRNFDQYGTEVIDTTEVWTLGGRTVGILCVEGRLRCECKDDSMGWEEQELSCTEGDACWPRYPGTEAVLANPRSSGSVNLGLRPWSMLSDTTLLGDEIHEACLVRGMYAAKYATMHRRKSCSASPAHDGSHGLRASLGDGRCRNLPLESCGRFYTRVGCEWALCETKMRTKVCDVITRRGKNEHERFIERMEALDQIAEETSHNPNTAEAIFALFDVNHRNYLDPAEFHQMCTRMHFKDCNALLHDFDTNNDHKIDRNEVVLYFSNTHELWDLPYVKWKPMMDQAREKEMSDAKPAAEEDGRE